MSCSYATWDGAYVLGSLSQADRRDFEGHLAACDDCSRAVRDLAGLPGLLGRLGPEVFDEGEPEPVPETLLPRLVDAMHRGQRRRTWLTAGLAAAAAVVVTAGGALVLDQQGSGSPVATNPPSSAVTATASPMPMTQVGVDPMTASVSLTPVAWGTRVDMTCTYPRLRAAYEAGAYALVVHTTGGRTERIATWRGLPGRSMKLTGATASRTSQIRSVEVTRLDGSPVLRLAL
jgi:anti-sigma factor RsiW